MVCVILVVLVENEVEGVEEVADTFAQLQSLLGKQFVHYLLAFTQTQPLHKHVILHLLRHKKKNCSAKTNFGSFLLF